MSDQPTVSEDGRTVTYPILGRLKGPKAAVTYPTPQHATWAVTWWRQVNGVPEPAPTRNSVKKKTGSTATNLVNHFVIVLDASSSMDHLTRETIKVVDNQIAHMATRSQEHNQETRITVLVFADDVEVVVWDMDVLRMPSIAEYYKPWGNTALVDATRQAISDQLEIPTKYGDHAFWLSVFTDGANNINNHLGGLLAQEISRLAVNWTVSCYVPTDASVYWATKFGFPKGNIAVWDATTEKGMEAAGKQFQATTDMFMENRAVGIRGYNTTTGTGLFSTGVDAVNSQTIQDADLEPLDPGKFTLVHVTHDTPIRKWVKDECGLDYVLGTGYYELTKTESIQPQKKIAIMHNRTKEVYTGPNARKVLNLPNMEVRVKPDKNPDYKIFVQSTSTNRKLLENTKLLLIHNT